MASYEIRVIEKRINDILFKICIFVTTIAIGMAIVEFFTRGEFPPTRIGAFYIGVLIVYSFHKEALRWIGEKATEVQQRRGEYFVYLWIIVTAILYLINFLTKDYFRYSSAGVEIHTLEEITIIALGVIAVFIFTRVFKIFAIFFKQKSDRI